MKVLYFKGMPKKKQKTKAARPAMRPCSLLVEQNGLIYTSVWFSALQTSSHNHGNVQDLVKCLQNWPIRSAFAALWGLMCVWGFFGRCMQTLHRNTHNPFHAALHIFSPPQRHKSTIRRVPTQSALLFSPATPLRPASCKSSTANWQIRGTQQPRYSTSPKTLHYTTHAPHRFDFLLYSGGGAYLIISCHESLSLMFYDFDWQALEPINMQVVETVASTGSKSSHFFSSSEVRTINMIKCSSTSSDLMDWSCSNFYFFILVSWAGESNQRERSQIVPGVWTFNRFWHIHNFLMLIETA